MEFKMEGLKSQGEKLGGGLKKIVKNKKLMIILGVGIVLILFLVMRNKNRSSNVQMDTATLAGGYGSIQGGGGAGGTSESSDFAGALDSVQKNFADIMGQQNSAQTAQMQAIQAQNANAMSAINEALANMTGSYQNSLAEQKAGFDLQMGDLNAQYGALGKQYAELQAQVTARNNALSASSQPTSYVSSSGGSSYNNSGSLSGAALEQAKQNVISSNNYDSNVNKYISGVVSSQSQASLQQAANTAQSNNAALQAARDAYKGNSTSTPGVAQASVAKVEVVKKK